MFRKGSRYSLRPDRVRSSDSLIISIVPLAYMMAKTHGLTEFAKTLEETL